jgi:serine/threonine protein kinase
MVAQPTLEQLRRWDPERIGPYVLLGRLGAGAMGQVYLGRSTAGRLVAVKTIKIELAEEPGFRDHFAHEVAAARRVSGMFTAAVVAADPEADVPWLATAYIPAPSLSRLVRSCGPQPLDTIWWLAAGCAEALESIHGAGLVHRDLKPSNVLVAPDGPRVIDFGVARAAERIQLTVTRGAVGTPAYMAPEQARDTRQASMASDVFALGATLLFAATGHAPYQGETVMDVLVRLATEPPDLTALPAELTSLITACLERSPRDRPTSAALLEQLGPLVDGPSGNGTDHSYLTEPAMSLIGEFQRSPQPEPRAAAGEASDGSLGSATSLPPGASLPGAASEASEASEDSLINDPGEDGLTFASHLALPAPPAPAPRRWPWRRQRRLAPRRHQATLSLAGRSVAAVVLVGAGAGLGVLITDLDSDPVSQDAVTTGPVTAPPGPPPGVPSSFPQLTGRNAQVGMIQPFGDGSTVFVLHGVNWLPGRPLSVRLAGHGVSPVHPVPDREGSFNYGIDQGHLFFAGLIPPGHYLVIVTGPGDKVARTDFVVNALTAGPGSPPPPAATGTPPPATGTPPPAARASPPTAANGARPGAGRPSPASRPSPAA